MKKMFYKNIRFVFLIFILYIIYLKDFLFHKYKKNKYYRYIIDKSFSEIINSCIIFMFWILLITSEENNPILLILAKKRNTEIKRYNIYKFEIKNEITNNNYNDNRANINISIYKKYPLVILEPSLEKINDENFDKISIGMIE